MSINSVCHELREEEGMAVELVPSGKPQPKSKHGWTRAGGVAIKIRAVSQGEAGRSRAVDKSRSSVPIHPELYSLRFWAFLLIFLHHFLGPYRHRIAGLSQNPILSRLITTALDSGSLGLDLFFCMSSFLITGILVREIEANGRLNIAAFLARRCLRIFPLYFGFLALTVCVIPYFLPSERLSREYLVPFLLFGANWVCAFRGFPSSVAAPLWSVSGEQQFYLLWPALVSWLSPRRIVPIALGCIGVATVARIVVLRLGLPQPAIWANTVAHLDPIAAGALCSVALRGRGWRIREGGRRALLAVGLGLPIALIFALGPSVYHGPLSLLFYPASALACGCILAGVYREGRTAYRPSIVYLGQISYGLFVFHILAIQIARAATRPLVVGKGWSFKAALFGGDMIIAFGLTVGMAMLSYHYFERTFLRYKARFRTERSSRPEQEAGPERAGSAVTLFVPQMSRGVDH
jgi:peptidoglycan/LPS O-acetylase OafA/YrhL